jgi:hypothetical protein
MSFVIFFAGVAVGMLSICCAMAFGAMAAFGDGRNGMHEE